MRKAKHHYYPRCLRETCLIIHKVDFCPHRVVYAIIDKPLYFPKCLNSRIVTGLFACVIQVGSLRAESSGVWLSDNLLPFIMHMIFVQIYQR